MRNESVHEFGKIPRSRVPRRLWHRLQRFDERLAAKRGDTVFDWGRLGVVRAKSYVGVVQVPGLAVEVLPKVSLEAGEAGVGRSRRNLLAMLQGSGLLPVQERDLAALQVERSPMLECLITVFVRRLMDELHRGVDRGYRHQEDNLGVVRGKLLLTEHLRRNAARPDRVFVGFDEFLSDTLVNRILKAGCRRLLSLTVDANNAARLGHALDALDEAGDIHPREHDFDRLVLNRNTERFRPLLAFCRQLLTGSSTAPSIGDGDGFSLLFPMEQVFESYVGHTIRRHAAVLGFGDHVVELQGHGRYLLRDEATPFGRRFALRPDVVVRRRDTKEPVLVLDTKWKRLLSDAEDRSNGVGRSDLYQLYAYATRYGCPRNVLLYPKLEGVSNKAYRLIPDATPYRVETTSLDLGIDLVGDRQRFLDDLRGVLMSESVKDV